MTEELDLTKLIVPYGILQFQRLKEVKCNDNKMTFKFDIDENPDNLLDCFKPYARFKHCDMTVEMTNEPFNYFYLKSDSDRKGKFKGLILGQEELLNIVNNAYNVTLNECSATAKEFTIELCLSFDNATGKLKKYRAFQLCIIKLNADKVEWNWY